MNIDEEIKLLELLIYYIENDIKTSFEYHFNDDDYIKYLEKIKFIKRDNGDYIIYYDDLIKKQIQYDLRELKLQKILNNI